MHLVLFSIVALCIAGSRSQETAISTEYLRAHAKDALSSEAAINAQLPVLPPVAVVAVGTESSTASTTAKLSATKAKASSVATSTAAGTSTAKDESSESDDDKHRSHDHEHDIHHDHDATISVDVHNILDLFKHELHEVEERIVAAIHHSHEDHNSTATPIVQSYRTASR